MYFYARAVAWKYNNKGTLPNYGTVIVLYNNDYSTDENALISQTNQSFTINTNITKLENGNYNISNPYYAENAAISIFMSCLPGSGEVKIARIAEKALHKQVTIATRTVLCNKGLTTYSSYLHEYAKTFETGVGCSAFVECCRYHPND